MDLEAFTADFISKRNNSSQRLIDANSLIVIPVVVHVLHRGEAIGAGRNISMAQIQSQIDVLNEDFRRLNTDASNTPAAFGSLAADLRIEFKLACQDPSGNSTNGVVRQKTSKTSFSFIINPINDLPDEAAMGIKMTSIAGSDSWPTDRYLNIWVADISGQTLGYSTFPGDFAANPNVDGVVIKTTAFGRVGNVAAPFDRGRTATHEVAHWLNLFHIFGAGPCGDDFVDDTPPQSNPTYHCPVFPQASNCTGAGPNGRMFMNYMDYTNDDCMNIFTSGQRQRARAIFALGGPRHAFINNYFRINEISFPICPSGKVSVTNPNCLPVTWTVISGPVAIQSGQGTNTVTLQRTGNGLGDAMIRATAEGYTDERMVSVGPLNVGSFSFLTSGTPCLSGTHPIYFGVGIDVPNGTVTGCALRDYAGVTEVEWQINSPHPYQFYHNFGGYSCSSSGYVYDAGITLGVSSYPQPYVIILRYRVKNDCGWSEWSPGNYKLIQACSAGLSYKLSPNPANAYIDIELEGNGDSLNRSTMLRKVQITDKTGKMIKEFNIKGGVSNTRIGVDQLKPDLYIIRVFNGAEWTSKTFIKQ